MAEARCAAVLELLDGVEGCEAFMQRMLGQSHENRELARAVANGSVTLGLDRLPACLEYQRSCLLAPRVEYTACREVFAGTVPLGGSWSRSARLGGAWWVSC
jgi:hypothetical protein